MSLTPSFSATFNNSVPVTASFSVEYPNALNPKITFSLTSEGQKPQKGSEIIPVNRPVIPFGLNGINGTFTRQDDSSILVTAEITNEFGKFSIKDAVIGIYPGE